MVKFALMGGEGGITCKLEMLTRGNLIDELEKALFNHDGKEILTIWNPIWSFRLSDLDW